MRGEQEKRYLLPPGKVCDKPTGEALRCGALWEDYIAGTSLLPTAPTCSACFYSDLSSPRFLCMLVPEATEVPGKSVWLLAQEQAPGRRWGRADRRQVSVESPELALWGWGHLWAA